MSKTVITTGLIRSALSHIPANIPRDEWARVGMAIKSEFPDADGQELFDAWSATADGYDTRSTRSTWRSIKAGGGVGVGTLLHIAKEHGFVLPKAEGEPVAASPAAVAQRAKERAQRQQAEREQQHAMHVAAAAEAAAMWGEASDAGDSAYLTRKGVQAHGVRFESNGVVLVPLRDEIGTLWNVQRIAPVRPAEGTDKLFLKGGRKSGLWHMLGLPAAVNTVLLLAEGYATAASLHEATGHPVAVAFDAGNLASVAKALRQQYPHALIVVCGDDDASTEARTSTNPGRMKAEAAARSVKGVAVFPVATGAGAAADEPANVDFNDMHLTHGLDAVRDVVAGAIAAHQPSAPLSQPKSQRNERAAVKEGDGTTSLDPFTADDAGVHFHGRDREGNPARPLWLCSPLNVSAITRDQDGQGWGYLLQFADPLGRSKQWAMPARMLAGDGGEYRSVLLNMGLRIATAPAARNKLTEFIQTRVPGEFASCTDRIGWHPTEGGAAYVLPHQTIGDDAERIVFQSDSQMENTFRIRKEVDAWRERVGLLCVGNTRLVFAVACAFAGPLLRPASMESGGFHLRGDSSSGKTTALRLAASVNGGPSYMQRWRTTDNALESIAAQHCDALLILDELAQVEGKVAGECAYMLANEQSKARATRNGAPRARLSWRLLFLSAGELGLADHMAEGMKRTRTGQEVRMADIPADAGAGLGAFEQIHGYPGPAAFASHLAREVQSCYGAAGLAFLQWACSQWSTLPSRLRRMMLALQSQWVPQGASGQVERVAARFALVGVAGELATEAGLTGWPQGESERSARACFDAWLAARGGAGNGEVRNMLRQVRRFLESHGEGRFTWWHRASDDHNAKTLQRAGVRRMLNADGEPIKSNSQHAVEYGDRMPVALGEGVSCEYFILAETFKGEICNGFDHQAVCRVLADHGCLTIKEAGRYTISTKLPGIGKVRCYHIPPSIFELDV